MIILRWEADKIQSIAQTNKNFFLEIGHVTVKRTLPLPLNKVFDYGSGSGNGRVRFTVINYHKSLDPQGLSPVEHTWDDSM